MDDLQAGDVLVDEKGRELFVIKVETVVRYVVRRGPAFAWPSSPWREGAFTIDELEPSIGPYKIKRKSQ
jgi:hypothetical protein